MNNVDETELVVHALRQPCLEDLPTGGLIHFLDTNALPADIAEAVSRELRWRHEELALWLR